MAILAGSGCLTEGGRVLKDATPLLMNFLSSDLFLQGGGTRLPWDPARVVYLWLLLTVLNILHRFGGKVLEFCIQFCKINLCKHVQDDAKAVRTFDFHLNTRILYRACCLIRCAKASCRWKISKNNVNSRSKRTGRKQLLFWFLTEGRWKRRMRTPVQEAFFIWDTAYFIVIQWSIKNKVILHWITSDNEISYAVSRMKMPPVWEYTSSLLFIDCVTQYLANNRIFGDDLFGWIFVQSLPSYKYTSEEIHHVTLLCFNHVNHECRWIFKLTHVTTWRYAAGFRKRWSSSTIKNYYVPSW